MQIKYGGPLWSQILPISVSAVTVSVLFSSESAAPGACLKHHTLG